MWKSPFLVLVIACMLSASPQPAAAQQGFKFRITIENRSRDDIRCMIVDNESAVGADVDGETMFKETYVAKSDVVIIFYIGGTANHVQPFDPRKNPGIGFIVNPAGQVSPKLDPR